MTSFIGISSSNTAAINRSSSFAMAETSSDFSFVEFTIASIF